MNPTPAWKRRGMRTAIACQCLGTVANKITESGLLILYMSALTMSPARILFYLSLFSLTATVMTLGASYLADRTGIKPLGLGGVGSIGAALLCRAGGGFGPAAWRGPLLGACIIMMSAGGSLFGGGWFALLHGLVPPGMRGRFVGRLRISTRTTNLAAMVLLTFLLHEDSPVFLFQVILAVLSVSAVLRLAVYARIPDSSPPAEHHGGLAAAVSTLVRAPGFIRFLVYVLILSLCTRNMNSLLLLFDKDVLGFGDNLVIFMNIAFSIGAISGLVIAGKSVDRYGTRRVLVLSHFAFVLAFGLVYLRGFFSPPLQVGLMAIVHLMHGAILLGAGVAVTAEMLALIPADKKALASGLYISVLRLGIALAGFLSAWFIKSRIALPISFNGLNRLNTYDSLILLSCVTLAALVFLPGALPSVRKKPAELSDDPRDHISASDTSHSEQT